MPCLILCGHPCSGKTTLAEQIRQRALTKQAANIRNVLIINEALACPDQSSVACYANAQAEKGTRGALKSAFDRHISENDESTLVILDSSNYIKGFRCELHCISKAAGQKHGVIWVLNESNICKEWNQARRQETETYSDALMDELIMRFEPPDERNRWDNPLYRIDVRPPGDKRQSGLAMEALEQSVFNMHKLSETMDETSDTTTTTTKKTSSTFKRAGFKKKTPLSQPNQTNHDAIAKTTEITNKAGNDETKQTTKVQTVEEQIDQILDSFLRNVQPLKQGMSTQQHALSDANVLHNVDSITQQVCSLIAAAQNKSTTAGGRFSITLHQDKAPLWFHFSRRMAFPELRRLRRQYIQWVVAHPPEDMSERGVAQAFISHMEMQ